MGHGVQKRLTTIGHQRVRVLGKHETGQDQRPDFRSYLLEIVIHVAVALSREDRGSPLASRSARVRAKGMEEPSRPASSPSASSLDWRFHPV